MCLYMYHKHGMRPCHPHVRNKFIRPVPHFNMVGVVRQINISGRSYRPMTRKPSSGSTKRPEPLQKYNQIHHWHLTHHF